LSLADKWTPIPSASFGGGGLSRFWQSTGNIPDLSQFGAVRTEDIESFTGPLPGSPGMEDPGILGMGVEGFKEGFAAPFVGLGERLGLVAEGSRQRIRDEFEQARLAYLSGDPTAFRTLVAGASEILPSVLPMFPAGKAASAVGRFASASVGKQKAIGRMFGAAEGMLAGVGETAGQGLEASLLGAGIGGAFGAALPAAAMSSDASRVAKIMDSPLDLREKIRLIEKEHLASAGRVPQDVYEAAERARGAINKHENEMATIIRRMEQDVNSYAAKSGIAEDRVWRDIDDAMSIKGGIEDRLDHSLQATANMARDKIDGLTDELIDSGFLTKKQVATYEANRGQYIHRSREAWDDASFREKYVDENGVWTQEWHQYVDEMHAALQDPAKPPVEREVAEGILIDALNKATLGSDFRASGRAFSPADLRTRMRKKGGPEALRKMLGEYHDPRVNLRKSVLYMANDFELNKMFDEAGQLYEKMGLAKRQKYSSEEFPYQLSSSEYGALRGRGANRVNRERPTGYYFKNLDDVLALTEARSAGKDGFFTSLSGMTRWMKTVGSVVTHMRNITSGNWMLGMGGHMPNMFDGHAWKTAMRWNDPARALGEMNDVLGKKVKQYENAYNYLLNRNVVQQTTFVGDLKAYREQASRYLQGGGKIKDVADKVEGMATKLYQGTDDMWKVQYFLKEKARMKSRAAEYGATFSEKQLDEYAGSVVRDAMQVYSRVPNLVKKIRDFPLTGPFLSFPAEIARNVKNLVKITHAELSGDQAFIRRMFGETEINKLADLNPNQLRAIKSIGKRRMAGMFAATAAPIALAKASQVSFGMTGEQVEALRQTAVAPWSQNSQLFIVDRDEESGRISFIDLGFMDPYNYIKSPLLSGGRALKIMASSMAGSAADDNYGLQQLGEMLKDTVSPATQPEIWAGEVYRGLSTLSKMKSAPLDEKAKEVMYRVYRAAAPGTVLSMDRFVRGLDMPGVREMLPATTKYGQRFNPVHEALSISTGTRITQSDIPRAIQFKSREYFSARQQAKRFYNDEARNKSDRSVYRLSAAKRTGRETNEQAGQEVLRHIENARTLGLTNTQIIRQLNAGGVGKSDAIDLVYYGKVPAIRF